MTEPQDLEIAKAEWAQAVGLLPGRKLAKVEVPPNGFPHQVDGLLDNGTRLAMLVFEGHVLGQRNMATLGRYLRSIDFLHAAGRISFPMAAKLFEQWGEFAPGGFGGFLFTDTKGPGPSDQPGAKWADNRFVMVLYRDLTHRGGITSLGPPGTTETYLRATLTMDDSYLPRWSVERAEVSADSDRGRIAWRLVP